MTMIRCLSAAVSSSVQSGRMFGAKVSDSGMLGARVSDSAAFTYVPSVAEGVLASAERGGYQGGPGPPKCPLQRLSTRRVYVVTRRQDAQLDPTRLAIAVPFERQLADLVGMSLVIKINEIAAERISSRPRWRRLVIEAQLGGVSVVSGAATQQG
jgi:hypothetical protein